MGEYNSRTLSIRVLGVIKRDFGAYNVFKFKL